MESGRMIADNSGHDGLSGDILPIDFSDTGVLADNRRGVNWNAGDSNNHSDIHLSDIQPRSGAGIRSDDSRIDDNIWGDLLSVELEFDGRIVRSGGVELLDAETSVDEFSAVSSIQQLADPISNEFDYFSSFAEIEQIFETQKLQETLAAEIISAANAQRLQNQQTEINQAVQEKRFAYLMQLSENSAPNSITSDDSSNNPTALETVYQNFLTDGENLDRFAQSVEEHHFSEEKAQQTVAENSARNTKLQDRNTFDEEEEPEEYEDHPDFEQERGFSLSM